MILFKSLNLHADSMEIMNIGKFFYNKYQFQVSSTKEQVYIFNILRTQAMVSVDDAYSKFLLKDFDAEKNILKVMINVKALSDKFH